MSQLKTNSIVDASGGNTATINGVAPNVNNIRGKNKIINGNFDVWQRGTGAFTSGYTTDRFWIDFTDASPSVSQSSFTLGQTNVPNEPKHYLTYTTTTASTTTERALIQQGVEGVRSLAGQTATLSFWAKADAAKNMAVDFRQFFGGGGGSADAFITPQTVSLTTSWQKFEVTVAVPSISGATLGSTGDDQLLVRFWFSCGSAVSNAPTSLGTQSGTFDIAQVQLEAGDTASGFEHLSYGETLAMCQRYYQPLYTNTVYGQRGNGNNFIMYARHIVPMRATPTGDSTGSSTNSGTVYLSPVDNLGTRYGAINCTVDNIASTTIATLDAEL